MRHGPKRLRRGFTLLELLIVSAVISILAAIAIPNLLEAQTRAKVAKAKGNIRVLIDASDIYHTDWNSYPSARPILPGDPFGILADHQLAVLTTPIPYAPTSSFRDPFGQVQGQIVGLLDGTEGTRAGEFPIPSMPNEGRSLLYYHYPSFSALTLNPRVKADGLAAISLGPDQLDSFGVFRPFDRSALSPLAISLGISDPVDTQYDPTNGTISRGDVFGFTGNLPIQRLP